MGVVGESVKGTAELMGKGGGVVKLALFSRKGIFSLLGIIIAIIIIATIINSSQRAIAEDNPWLIAQGVGSLIFNQDFNLKQQVDVFVEKGETGFWRTLGLFGNVSLFIIWYLVIYSLLYGFFKKILGENAPPLSVAIISFLFLTLFQFAFNIGAASLDTSVKGGSFVDNFIWPFEGMYTFIKSYKLWLLPMTEAIANNKFIRYISGIRE